MQLIFHAWGAMPLMRDGAVAGVIFESKEGRKAIRAAVTIDCTGDGDIFHRAGARQLRRHRHPRHPPLHQHRLAVRRRRHARAGSPSRRRQPAGFTAFMERGRAACGGLFERPFVSWRNDVALFMGPRLAGYSAVDVEDLTEVDIRSHRLMARAPRGVSRACAGVRGRLPDAVRAADRRAPRAPPGRRASA